MKKKTRSLFFVITLSVDRNSKGPSHFFVSQVSRKRTPETKFELKRRFTAFVRFKNMNVTNNRLKKIPFLWATSVTHFTL